MEIVKYTNVSIIIPVYKVEQFIEECLNSVFRQTYDHIEIIIVNDCTPDSSMKIAVKELQSERNRFEYKVIEHVANQGLSAARNSGVKVATGKWLYFLDSDDEITPNCIGSFIEIVDKYAEADFAVGGIKVLGSGNVYRLTTPEYIVGGNRIMDAYIHGMWYEMAWNKLINRDFFILNDLWFKESLLHEDQLFSYLLASRAISMATISNETYIYKIRNVGSITSSNGTRNFDSYIYILEYMVHSIVHKYPEICAVPEYSLAIRFAYSILLSLYKKNQLDKNQIVCYENKVDELRKVLRSYRCDLPLVLYIKVNILSLPRSIRKSFLAWHGRQSY